MTPNTRSISQASECFRNSHVMDVSQPSILKVARAGADPTVIIQPLYVRDLQGNIASCKVGELSRQNLTILNG